MARGADSSYMTINHFLTASGHILKAQTLIEHARERKSKGLSVTGDKTRIAHFIDKATLHHDNYRQYIKTLTPEGREDAIKLLISLEEALNIARDMLKRL